ncbi:MAG TPA: methylenetetrahydrofolate reductase [Streptosporangiaceae bacterium]|nr:methylenetetrahydrofolate reductase [Streptosporangiaceae bacterium]
MSAGPASRLPGSGLRQAWPLLRLARYEVMPTRGAEQAVLDWVPREVTVTVTTSPTKGLDQTLNLTERLIAAGYRVVPHVRARLVRDQAHFDDVVARLVAAGVDDVFVPAGDADRPAGKFTSALDLLERLAEIGSPFGRVGITGYPQTHPKIDDDVTVQAMWDKRRHATYIVSNLCFDPAILRRWIARIRRRGVALPLLVGLAGPVERTKLMAMAAKIGAADSARFLSGHSSAFVRLSAPAAYRPERLLGRLGHTLTDPASLVEGLHIFTFNQVKQTETWRQRLLAQRASTGLDGSSALGHGHVAEL